MVTKEQEKKALAQIKTIISSLGEGSYIATAFQGCVEDAENNIEYDFGCSMMDRWINAEKKFEKATDTVKKLEKELAQKNVEVEEGNRFYSKLNDELTATNKTLAQTKEALTAVSAHYRDVDTAYRQLEDLVDKRDEEIIKLKAKLYDFMAK